jgi:hypothetical protein
MDEQTMTIGQQLDELIFVEDALDAIGQRQSMEQFALCHKPPMQDDARRIYDKAQAFIRSYGSRRKALNFVQMSIERTREQFFSVQRY